VQASITGPVDGTVVKVRPLFKYEPDSPHLNLTRIQPELTFNLLAFFSHTSFLTQHPYR
jgi:hypothetical protein